VCAWPGPGRIDPRRAGSYFSNAEARLTWPEPMTVWPVFTARCIVQSAVIKAIACRPSVHPSVTLVDQNHIGWKSWKLIARTISPTPSPKAMPHLLPGEHREIWGDWMCGIGKVACWCTKAAISLKCVNVEEKLL